MCMEPFSAMTQPVLVGFVTYQCYKATVNEAETIRAAKPACGGSNAPACAALERS